MRTGVAYIGHHSPKHLKVDLSAIKQIGCDDVFLAAQEIDFIYKPGKLEFFAKIAKIFNLRPIAIFWGALNLFGGGQSSQFLLDVPEAHQVQKDGAYHPAGCYNNPVCVDYITKMIDRIAEYGFAGYFIDEPTTIDCYCASCQELFKSMLSGKLVDAQPQTIQEFRKKSVIHYIQAITAYLKKTHPALESFCCIMPEDKFLWEDTVLIKNLDNLGTDIYWANDDINVEEMVPLVQEMAHLCKDNNKKHHQWLQAWGVQKGRESRIKAQGEILLREKPDALYAWAYEGQIGTSESCADPVLAWEAATDILRRAKNI